MLNRKHRHIDKILVLIFIIHLIFQSSLIAQESASIYHEIGQGETLYSLSAKYNTSVSRLKSLNNIQDNLITVGQKILIGYDSIKSVETKREIDFYQQIIEEVDELAKRALTGIKKKPVITSIHLLEEFFYSTQSTSRDFEIIDRINEEKIKGLNADLGLKVIGGYTRNFAPEILNPEESFFNSWVSAGVSWELFNGGLLGNKSEINRLEKEAAINQLMASKAIKRNNYGHLYNQIIYGFNKARFHHLEKRKRLVSDFLTIAQKLYHTRSISWEEVIEWKTKHKETLEALNNVATYNKAFESSHQEAQYQTQFDALGLPILSIQLNKLIGDTQLDSLDEKLVALHQDRLAIEHRNNRDLSLSAQFKYNAITGQANGRSRAYGSFKLSLSAPLFKNKRSQQVQEQEAALIEQRLVQESQSIRNEIMNLYHEYEYALKQHVSFTGKKAQIEERIRRARASQTIAESEYATKSTLVLLDDLNATEYELIDIKQKLYLLLLKIYTISNAGSLTEFTQSKDFRPDFKKNADQRGVYLWSGTFESIDVSYLLSYIANNEIERVMLSSGVDAQRKQEFLKQAVESDLAIYQLIGENSYASKGFTQSLKDRVEKLDEVYDGIHLDIEPHALSNWNENKTQLLDSLVSVIEKSKSHLPRGKSLSVSIPVHFPTETAKRIFRVADEVVLMAYGSVDLDVLQRRIADELSFTESKVKLTIALRAKDFDNRIELEERIQNLTQKTGIERFIIQDLGDLISLDQETILVNLNKEK